MAPRTAASISAAAASSDSPGSSLRISDSVQRSGTAMIAAAGQAGDQQEAAADQRMLGARRDRRRNAPKAPSSRHGWPQRILAEFRHAEIGGLAGDRDVGDEEADLRRIDGKPRRLDIDDEIGRGDLAGLDARDVILDAGGDAGAGLAALLVADKGEGDIARKADAGLVEQRQRGKRGADAGLEIAGAAPPDLRRR